MVVTTLAWMGAAWAAEAKRAKAPKARTMEDMIEERGMVVEGVLVGE
jgi:hypothetical protein